ncbi:helix-turn-helix domain-containing protein [Pedobacter flavus]|uniref:Helix-turn-helix transcriptional regulator n=1 Tax=Pedobacter flavus TaxID=3113906 RepID=A0ABU7GYP5_9SPHI|nr:helix-turn-helix transcriptional regulator [Pedobacter sp. VNH31]MEE1883982.1 helix-turn-helix transcriptional regulator [Pedobacter sp. VNH31]
MNNIGFNIRRIRGLRGFKQAYMAHALKISINSYGKIERNEVNLKISRLEEIALVLKTTVEHILTFEENDYFKKR